MYIIIYNSMSIWAVVSTYMYRDYQLYGSGPLHYLFFSL